MGSGPEEQDEIGRKDIVDTFVAPECKGVVEILYQDEDILLINKPSGLFSLSGKNPANWDSVHYRLVHGQEGVTEPFPMAILPHRLDLGTSGIMVVGLHAEASKHLNRQFQNRSVKKKYVALLDGRVSDDEGVVCFSIAKDRSLFPKVKLCEVTGKLAVSRFRVLERLEEPVRTLVEYVPETGRTHQLRIHSLAMGHPIAGCDLYHNEHSTGLAERLMLHANTLKFIHPRTGKLVCGVCGADALDGHIKSHPVKDGFFK